MSKKVDGMARNMKLAYAEKALAEIKSLAEMELGDWAGIETVYVPESLQTVAKILEICESLE